MTDRSGGIDNSLAADTPDDDGNIMSLDFDPPRPLDCDIKDDDSISFADGDGDGRSAPSPRKRIKRVKVDHTYRDFSKLPLPEVSLRLVGDDDAAGGADGPPAVRASKNVNFPRKLYDMVTNPDYQHIICFMPHGRSWAVLDKKALVLEVLPKYFNHSRFESFNRQVNGWGFKRLLRRGPDHKSYYHECFLRGLPELSTLMNRLVSPGKRIPDRDHEPDFYRISKDSPLPEFDPGAVLPRFCRTEVRAKKTVNNKKSPRRGRSNGGSKSPPSRDSSSSTPGTENGNVPVPLPLVKQAVMSSQDISEALRRYRMIARATAAPEKQGSNSLSRGKVMPRKIPGMTDVAVVAAVPNELVTFQRKQAAETAKPMPGVLPSSVDRLGNALPPNVCESSAEELCYVSSYGIEPDPLAEGVPLKVRVGQHNLSNIERPGPLLEEFAEIYFSENGPSDEFL